MSTQNNLRRWALASAVAAMMATAAPSAFAQVADTPAPPATTPTTTPPGPTSATPDNSNTTPPASTSTPGSTSTPDSTAPTPMTPGMAGGTASTPMSSDMTAPGSLPTDYKILNNPVFDATNLEQARARGFSESQIATIVKISKDTGFPFDQVSDMVQRGKTFPQIATEYNLSLASIYDNSKEMQDISDYTALSKYAMSLGKNGGMMAMPMTGSSAPMTPPMAPMTPPMTTPAATPAPATGPLDIVATAMAAKNLTTLVKAIQAAGLVETLQGAGPFTVFAPTDKAFAKLPAGQLDALMADPAKLKMILTYHVIPANIMAADAMNMTSPTSPPTVEGATLQVTKGKKGKLKVNGANVVKADIAASNGTIHIIDAVLMPPTDSTMPMTTPAPADATTPPATAPAPTDATPPAAPAPTDATPPVAPAPGNATPTTPAPGATDATPPAAPMAPGTPATPGQ